MGTDIVTATQTPSAVSIEEAASGGAATTAGAPLQR